MAEITGRDQATVSRWERGELEPSRDDMERVRSFARSRHLRWNDKLFFEVPDDEAPVSRRPRKPTHSHHGAAA